MPRVKSYLKMRKARSEPESAVFNSECFAFFKLVHMYSTWYKLTAGFCISLV